MVAVLLLQEEGVVLPIVVRLQEVEGVVEVVSAVVVVLMVLPIVVRLQEGVVGVALLQEVGVLLMVLPVVQGFGPDVVLVCV